MQTGWVRPCGRSNKTVVAAVLSVFASARERTCTTVIVLPESASALTCLSCCAHGRKRAEWRATAVAAAALVSVTAVAVVKPRRVHGEAPHAAKRWTLFHTRWLWRPIETDASSATPMPTHTASGLPAMLYAHTRRRRGRSSLRLSSRRREASAQTQRNSNVCICGIVAYKHQVLFRALQTLIQNMSCDSCN